MHLPFLSFWEFGHQKQPFPFPHPPQHRRISRIRQQLLSFPHPHPSLFPQHARRIRTQRMQLQLPLPPQRLNSPVPLQPLLHPLLQPLLQPLSHPQFVAVISLIEVFLRLGLITLHLMERTGRWLRNYRKLFLCGGDRTEHLINIQRSIAPFPVGIEQILTSRCSADQEILHLVGR